MQKYQMLRVATEGNAAAMSKFHTTGRTAEWLLPKEYLKKNVILSADKIHPSLLLHEAGHIIDFNDTAKKGFLSRLYDNYLRGTITAETAAWNKAPQTKKFPKDHNKLEEGALESYRRGSKYPLIGAVAGSAVGLIPLLLAKNVKHNSTSGKKMITTWADLNSRIP